ncbi:hypothetical protein MHBO_004738 [Bonamia ostreae]|uniref:Uncharacterized protein n=1 Tax=Bonamia ostreae TaxID=126728 RepID=A0ABV2AU35_9EUKA
MDVENMVVCLLIRFVYMLQAKSCLDTLNPLNFQGSSWNHIATPQALDELTQFRPYVWRS